MNPREGADGPRKDDTVTETPALLARVRGEEIQRCWDASLVPVCLFCRGEGEVNEKECMVCYGLGVVEEVAHD